MDKFEMVLNSLLGMTDRAESINDKYKEILVLEKMLEENDIPYTKEPLFGGWHICYPTNSGSRVCSVVEHNGSYGREDDLLEIMGLLTEEEKSLTALLGTCLHKKYLNVLKIIMKVRSNNASNN